MKQFFLFDAVFILSFSSYWFDWFDCRLIAVWLPFDCRLIAVWPNNPFDSFQTDIDKDELTEMIQAISNLAREIDAWNRLMPS